MMAGKSERIGTCFKNESHVRIAFLRAGSILAPAVAYELASVGKVTRPHP